MSQGRKAMFALMEKAKILRLPTDIVLELFEACVVPVLLYGAEIWGWENLNDIEIFHRNCYGIYQKHSSSPQTACYMEKWVPLTCQQKLKPEW